MFCTIAAFSLNGEHVVRVLSFRMVFFYLVTTGWIFDISFCENSINQSIIAKASERGHAFNTAVV